MQRGINTIDNGHAARSTSDKCTRAQVKLRSAEALASPQVEKAGREYRMDI